MSTAEAIDNDRHRPTGHTRPRRRDRVRAANTTDRMRVQLDFAREAFTRLQEMRALTDARSHAEVIRQALRIYDYLLTAGLKDAAKITLRLERNGQVEDTQL